VGAVKDTYTLELVDKILAPFKKIEAAGAKVVQTMEKLEALGEKGLGLAKLIPIAGAALAGLWALRKGVEGLWWVMEKRGQAALGFGKAILSAVGFREKWRTMFAHQFGAEEGSQVYKKVLKAAGATPGLAADLMENVGRYANIGIRDDNLNAVVGATATIQAMFDNVKAEKFSNGVTDMWSKAKFDLQDFKQMFSGILGADKAQAAILRLKGINVAADKVAATFKKLHDAGKITGKEGLVGGLMAFQEEVEKGKPMGSFAKERGVNSLEGLLSNLEEAPANFLRSMDKLDTLPGLKSFKDFIKRVLTFFDLATPQGQKLAGVVEQLTNALFGGFDRLTDDDLVHWFEAGIEVAKRFVKLVERAWDVLGEILHGSWSSVLGQAAGFAVDLGMMIGSAIWQAFRASLAGSSPVLAKVLGFDVPVLKDLKTEEGGLRQRLKENPGDEAAGKRLREVLEMQRQLDSSSAHLPGRIVAGPGAVGESIGNISLRQTGSAVGEGFGSAWSSAGESFRKVGEALHLVSPSAPALQPLQAVGAAAVDAIHAGAAKRAEQLAGQGGGEGHMDAMIESLRGVAYRTGAPVT